MYEQWLCNILAILNEYFTNIKQAVILATYWNNVTHVSPMLRTSVWILHQCQNVFQRTYWCNIGRTTCATRVLSQYTGIVTATNHQRYFFQYYFWQYCVSRPNFVVVILEVHPEQVRWWELHRTADNNRLDCVNNTVKSSASNAICKPSNVINS